jgi:pyruvate dehydrogenase (quinone)
MACANAKYAGKLGVCLATSGPDGPHLLNGWYDAKLDGQPVLAITGMQFHDLIGTYTQQDVALDKVFIDVAVFNKRIMGPNHVDNIVDLACRTALGYRGEVKIGCGSNSHCGFPEYRWWRQFHFDAPSAAAKGRCPCPTRRHR